MKNLKGDAMRNTILLAVMVLSFAKISLAEQVDDNEFCGAVGLLAAQTMEARHTGVSMQSMLSGAGKSEDAFMKKLCERMIVEAYERPRLQTEEIRKRSVEEFRDKWHLECYKARKVAKR